MKTKKTNRYNFGLCSLNNDMLLIAGGYDGNFDIVNDCILFNTSSKQFKNLPSMSIKRESHVLVNVSGIIYAIGGWNFEDKYLASIEEFHPSTKEWKRSAFELQIARFNHQAVAHKHFIYVFGGACKDALQAPTIEKVNTVTNRVKIIATKLRVAKSGFAVAKVHEKIWIFGGRTSDVTGNWYLTDSVEIFDLNTEQIEQGVNMPFPNSQFTACVI